jgi:hypothetical protein
MSTNCQRIKSNLRFCTNLCSESVEGDPASLLESRPMADSRGRSRSLPTAKMLHAHQGMLHGGATRRGSGSEAHPSSPRPSASDTAPPRGSTGDRILDRFPRSSRTPELPCRPSVARGRIRGGTLWRIGLRIFRGDDSEPFAEGARKVR